MNKVFSILKLLEIGFVIRSYMIASIFFAGLNFLLSAPGGAGSDASGYMYFGMCWLVFPLSKLVYEELMGVVLGGNVVVAPALDFIVWKFAVNGLLFGLSPFIAPVGFLYLWYRHDS